ncbi:MAG: hypothetical protein HY056_11350 [Proteobacteria bacterium]|nr:hypothetical protein [Pseudomonadota bacterium]
MIVIAPVFLADTDALRSRMAVKPRAAAKRAFCPVCGPPMRPERCHISGVGTVCRLTCTYERFPFQLNWKALHFL